MFDKKRRLKKLSLAYGYGRSQATEKKSFIKTAFSKSLLKLRKKPPVPSAPKQLKRTRPFIKKIKKIAILAIIAIALILAIHSLFFSNFFLITDIKLADDKPENQIIGKQIETGLQSSIGKNLIFTDTKTLEDQIIKSFPEIEQIQISKSYPKTLLIQFSEFPLATNVINESASLKKTYLINSIGYAVKEDMQDVNLPFIRMKSDEPINTGNQVMDSMKLKYILDSITYFEDKFGMRVIEAQYKKIPREVHLLTEKKFYIWLDIQKPAEDQLKPLKKALVKLDIYKEPLKYIDLRIAGQGGNKIIYKRQ